MAGFWRKLIKSAVEDHEYGELNKAEETDLKSAGHVRRHYVITGRVQEVGFRYTAFYIAEELHLSGWVSNLDDGRVEMELQGLPETIEMLFLRLNGNGRIRIDSIEEEECALKNPAGFRVRG